MHDRTSWWTVTPDVFLGLVTHERSRFAEATHESGLLSSLSRELRNLDLDVRTGVSDQDSYSPDVLPLTRAVVKASIRGELNCEQRWRTYLSGRKPRLRTKGLMAARWAWRRAKYVPPWRRFDGAGDLGASMVRRLVNIELSHLRIMGQAVASGARWAILVEDDAAAPDTPVFARDIAEFIDAADKRRQPLTMNLSESFTPRQLGIEHLLTPIEEPGPWTMLAADRPVTNTVCAVLYRVDFLARLLTELQAIPLSPVIPIDFKVNEAMMRLAISMKPGDCWVASPAPLVQRSGVPNVWAIA